MTFRPSFLLRALALCGALFATTSSAKADDLVPSLSLQTGVTFTRSPNNSTNDYFVAATPSITWNIEGERVLVATTYSFTGSLNSVLPNGIANRLAINTAYDVDPRTRLVVGVEGLQALIGNYLLVRRAPATQLGGLPNLNTSLLTLGVNQGLTHDLTPVVRLSQGVTGTSVVSLDPDIPLNNYLATATVGVDRSWEFDAVGGELNVQYAWTFFPPIRSRIFTVALGPTWDHDITPNLSSSMGISAQVALSPDAGSKPRIGPSGRASLAYVSEGSGIGLEYAGGIEPNLLLGTLLNSHTATLRGFTPISERERIVFGLSGGFLRAKNVDLNPNGQFDNEFDAVLHDADVTWSATDWLSVYARYQFIGQTSGDGPGATPPIVRHGALLGIDLFAARPVERQRLPNGRLPQRVDRSDSQQIGKPSATQAAPKR